MTTLTKLFNVNINKLDAEEVSFVEAVLNAALQAYLIKSSSISLFYWVDQHLEFGISKEKAEVLIAALIKKGILLQEFRSNMKFVSLKINNVLLNELVPDLTGQMVGIRSEYYSLTASKHTFKTLIKDKIRGITEAYINREGMLKHSYSLFSYDTNILNKYKEDIVKELQEGLECTDKALEIDYINIIKQVVESTSEEEYLYNLEGSYFDSRGRQIHKSQRKINDPISSKEFRSLIKVKPAPLTKQGEQAVYLFIAELLGYKPSTLEEKLELGKQAYKAKEFTKNIHENIWLERLYNNLEDKNNWVTPIELDASASMLQIIGCVLEDKTLLEATNVITYKDNQGNTLLRDPWTLPNIPRKALKAVATPRLYGSSTSTSLLLKKAGIEPSKELVKDIDIALSTGYLGLANNLGKLLTKQCVIDNRMLIDINNEMLEIVNNHTVTNGFITKSYNIININNMNVEANKLPNTLKSKHRLIKATQNKPKKYFDKARFKRYFATLLIHNLDSQVMEKVVSEINYFVLPIHDAFITHPNNNLDIKNKYKDAIKAIINRDILLDYCKQIGITEDNKTLNSILNQVTPIDAEVGLNGLK